jgi:NRAMP (natural resistance-associated macrophage protein)-like metal ion transporter
VSNKVNKFHRFLKILGPGLITGAADDDPSGIATHSQSGAQFGYGLLWLAIFMLPFQTAVQEACARIGAVKGKGLVAVIKDHYSKKIVYLVCLLILIANTINIGADLGAMAAAMQLIAPLNFAIWCIFFTIVVLLLEIFTNYRVYAKILKWLAMALLSYLLTVFLVRQPWATLLKSTFVPHFEFTTAFLFIVTGVLGTTISPYMFFWQASEEVEEEREMNIRKINGVPVLSAKFIKNMRIDTFIGMIFCEIVTWSIMVVAGTVLHQNGILDIKTSADAAKALEPLVNTFPNSGYLAKLLFSIGVVGVGLLSVPVLSGSASYAISEALNWREGLNLKFKKAHGFYGVISLATLVGLMINFVGIDPVKALIYAAVINGVVAVPLLYLIAKTAQSEEIMGENKSGPLSKTLLWITLITMGLAAVSLGLALVLGNG